MFTHKHASGPIHALATDIYHMCMCGCTSRPLHAHATDANIYTRMHIGVRPYTHARLTCALSQEGGIRVCAYTHTTCMCTCKYEDAPSNCRHGCIYYIYTYIRVGFQIVSSQGWPFRGRLCIWLQFLGWIAPTSHRKEIKCPLNTQNYIGDVKTDHSGF